MISEWVTRVILIVGAYFRFIHFPWQIHCKNEDNLRKSKKMKGLEFYQPFQFSISTAKN